MSLPFLPFPATDEPAGDWAKSVLSSSWDFEGSDTGHRPDQVRAFLERVAEENPRRRSLDDLGERDWDRLEAVMTDYRRAYERQRRLDRENSRRSRMPAGLWD